MKLLVAGPGAVGGFLAARLSEAGHEVTILARSGRAARLRDDGLRLADPSGPRTLRLPVVTAAELTAGWDAILLAVKSAALDEVIADIAPAVEPATVIIPFLNGMGHLDALGSKFGAAVLGGVLKVVTQLADDGTVQVLAPMFEVELGELDGSRSDRAEALAAAFRDAGADVTISSDIVGAMWAKWVSIASVGAVTSLMRAPIGDIVAVPGGEDFARSVLAEAASAAAAAGHPVPADHLDATWRILTAPGSPGTSSLSRDLMAGRPTEVEAVLADFATRAEAAAADTPLIALSALALRVHNRRLALAIP